MLKFVNDAYALWSRSDFFVLKMTLVVFSTFIYNSFFAIQFTSLDYNKLTEISADWIEVDTIRKLVSSVYPTVAVAKVCKFNNNSFINIKQIEGPIIDPWWIPTFTSHLFKTLDCTTTWEQRFKLI